jgi:heat-inducible transcriptional repressor
MLEQLTDRQRRILARLVAEYIEQGEPVSSSWLAEHSALGVSSATVRNVLARLEEQGLVQQPHTSAGRVPTTLGYRLYVDWLLDSRRPTRLLPEIEARLRRAGTIAELFESASHELSEASRHVGFALAAPDPSDRLRHIDFVALEGRRVLVIVVATGGQITHKVIETDEAHLATVLTQAANYINAEFTGLTLQEARAAIVEHLREERLLYDALVAQALRLAQAGLDEVMPEETVHVQGASHLVDVLLEEGTDRDRALQTLHAVFRMIEEKHRLVELLTEYIDASGLTVVVAPVHLSPDLHSLSVIASTFRDGSRTGALGVIGPLRMRYQRAISVVDSMSQAMTRVLERQ